jgi:hypothetical protein
MYTSRYTDGMDIHIEGERNTVLVQQKWKYDWSIAPGLSNWTYAEKKSFHDRLDKLVWGQWGGHFVLRTTGSSAFAKAHSTVGLRVNFDVKWVLSAAHWDVEVQKISAGAFQTSSVNWAARKINFDTEDLQTVKRSSAGKDYHQYPAMHEFGHALGNSIYASAGMHGDEYKASSAYYSDKSSMMNIGRLLRKRHIDFLISELNQMLPNTTFYASDVL